MDLATALCAKSFNLDLCLPNAVTRRKLAAFWRQEAGSHPEIRGFCIEQATIADREAEAMDEGNPLPIDHAQFKPTQGQESRAVPDMVSVPAGGDDDLPF